MGRRRDRRGCHQDGAGRGRCARRDQQAHAGRAVLRTAAAAPASAGGRRRSWPTADRGGRPAGRGGFLDDPQCRAAVASTARLLESLGHHVEQSAPAAMFEQEFIGHFNTIIAADAEATFQAFEMLLGRPIGEDEIEPRNAEYRRAGQALNAVAYLGSRMWLGMWARRMADWWRDHDLLLTPTLGAPPPELGWFTAAGPQQEGERIVSFIPYTAQFNMTGRRPSASRCTPRPRACRSACSWPPPTGGRTCSSGSRASSKRPRPGAAAPANPRVRHPAGRFRRAGSPLQAGRSLDLATAARGRWATGAILRQPVLNVSSAADEDNCGLMTGHSPRGGSQ